MGIDNQLAERIEKNAKNWDKEPEEGAWDDSIEPFKSAFSIIGGDEAMKIVWGCSKHLMGWSSVTLEVFLRKNFGERYLSWPRLITGWMIVSSFLMFPMAVGKPSKLYFFVYLAFILRGIWHRNVIARRNWRGDRWHSRCRGHSIFGMPDTPLFSCWIEPIGCFLIALPFIKINPIIGIWFGSSAVFLFMKRQMEYQDLREKFLDKIDAQIDGKYWAEVMDGNGEKKPQDMEGHMVLSPDLVRMSKQRISIADTVAESMG